MDGGGVVGTPYPVTLRLYLIAIEHWPNIDAAYASVDLIRLAPHRFLNCVYAWCTERIAPEKLEEWLFMLGQPLPGQAKKKATPAQVDDEGASFMALMGQVQG